MSKKGCDRVSWWFLFCTTLLPSSSVQSKFWFRWKVWLLETVSVPAYSVIGAIRLSCTRSASRWTPRIMGPLNPALMEHPNAICKWGGKGRWTRMLHASLLLTHMLHFPSDWTYKFKDKIVRNFNTLKVEHYNKLGALLRAQPCVAAQITHLRRQLWLPDISIMLLLTLIVWLMECLPAFSIAKLAFFPCRTLFVRSGSLSPTHA